MIEDAHIIQEGRLLLNWGELDDACFRRAPVWCEYYDPDELETMLAWGKVSRAWLDEHIIGHIEGTNRSVWYAPADDVPVPRCEIMAISAILRMDGLHMNGYLTLVAGEIASASIFTEEDEDVILSLVLGDHNREALGRLAKRLQWPRDQHPRVLFYEARGNNPFGIASGALDIPVTSPSETTGSSDAS